MSVLGKIKRYIQCEIQENQKNSDLMERSFDESKITEDKIHLFSGLVRYSTRVETLQDVLNYIIVAEKIEELNKEKTK